MTSPDIEIVAGSPSEAEIAALVAALTVPQPPSKARATTGPRVWAAPVVRVAIRPGHDAWRAQR